MNHRRRLGGFTLIEVLVVLVIVAVGLAITLPVVQKSRADARRDKCILSLRHIGIGLHNYHQVHRTFPPGWTGHSAEPGPLPRFGWIAYALPFLDQYGLYKELDMKNHKMDNRKLVETHIPAFRCPADSTPALNALRGSFGTTNYSGNFGPVAAPRWAVADFGSSWPGQPPTVRSTDGMFCLNSSVRSHSITDGTSNTIFVGERSVESRSGIWMGVRGNEFEDDQVTDSSFGNEINTGDNSFSSRHPGGANFRLGDGSVRFISEKIDSRPEEPGSPSGGTFQRLSNRYDGRSVGEF
ncbi:MAG: prepilin-type N-terminal cleavage/methylation domain-containing protein [Planctomycetaceae bacterium]|jgi:prepilin-type N-terminal cleavage/methylation domain-containing protein